MGQVAYHRGRGGDQVSVTFELEQAGDLADDQMFRGQTEPRAQGEVIPGPEKRFEIKAAEDPGELRPTPNASREVLARHCVCHDDEMGCATTGPLFRGTEEAIGGRSLELTKGRAVDGMDDDWDARGPRRETPHETGLSAMRVDNLRPCMAEDPAECHPCDNVFPRMDWPDECWDTDQQTRHRGGKPFEGSLGPGGRAADQLNIEIRPVTKTKNRGERILLGAANDQAGYDVDDTHARGPRAEARMIPLIS